MLLLLLLLQSWHRVPSIAVRFGSKLPKLMFAKERGQAGVSCGGHNAISCARCPYGSAGYVGELWCNGECQWIDGHCSPKGGTGPSYCEDDYTFTGRTCVRVVKEAANYLQAILGCQARGDILASVQSQEEQDIIHGLTGTVGAWIGLTDFLDEGTFAWVDESELTFTNWKDGRPNNNNNNQHCAWIRPDGMWNDVTCKKEKHYVCQQPFIEVILE